MKNHTERHLITVHHYRNLVWKHQLEISVPEIGNSSISEYTPEISGKNLFIANGYYSSNEIDIEDYSLFLFLFADVDNDDDDMRVATILYHLGSMPAILGMHIPIINFISQTLEGYDVNVEVVYSSTNELT